MKIEIDFERCESNGLCMEVMPEVFELRDDNFLYLLADEVGPEQEAAAEEAARVCPRHAIQLHR